MVNTYSLVSLSEVKNFIGMEKSDSLTDDLLEDLINRISVLFESYMNRNVLSREYTEDHDGKGAMVLFPKQSPITTVSGIWDDYDWEYTDDDLIDADNYKIIDENCIVFKNVALNNYTANIRITYTAGFTTVPDDLKQATISEVTRMYKNKNQLDVTTKTLSDGSVIISGGKFLPLTHVTLKKYKRLITV